MNIRIAPDGTVQTPGWDYGSGKKEVWHRNLRFITLKIAGSKQWSGLGQQSYYPTRFHVYAISREGVDGGGTQWLSVEEVASFPLSAPDSTVAYAWGQRERTAQAAQEAR